jgi:hypothetical protein
MALSFINNMGQTKIEGEFIYDTINYEYTLYLSPFNSKTIKNEIINYFGKRKVNISKINSNTGEKTYVKSLCLGLNEDFFKNNWTSISAFIKVNPKDIDNVASATIQIYDHCENNPDKTVLQYAQVWVNDVCRVSNIPGNIGNPVNVLFYIIEQLTMQNLGKDTLNLFIEKTPIENLNALYPKYVSLGFQRTEEDETCEQIMIHKNSLIRDEEMMENERIREKNEKTIEKNKLTNKKRKIQLMEPIELTPEWDNIIMSKTGIISQPNIIDLSLQQTEETKEIDELDNKRRTPNVYSIGGKRIYKTKKYKTIHKSRNKLTKNKNKYKMKV